MAVVLLIEDNKSTRLLTKLNLQQEYQILEAENGLEALDILEQQHIDLIIADIMMPHMDGYEFVRQLRCIDQMTPILFLTARKDWQDMKNGFALGIDDYMTKPVHYEELLWRVRALLRRAKINNEKSIRIGDVVIDGENYIVMRGTEIISLPRKEFELLFKLLSYPKKIFTISQLLDDIWGYETNSDETTVRTHINRLRKRFAGCQEFEIVTVRGLGYKGELRV